MRFTLFRLGLFVFAATVAAKAGVSSNKTDNFWPAAPLSSLPQFITTPEPAELTLVDTNIVENANSNVVASPVNSVASKAAVSSNNTHNMWPALGLAPGSKSSVPREPAELAQNNTNMVANPTNAVASTNADMDNNHVLEPGDSISFQVLEDKEDPLADNKGPVSLTVTDSSEVNAPYVGLVSVAGKTCEQVAADLKALLEKDYYYKATVVVGLQSMNKVRGQAFVCGEVRAQGSVNIMFNEELTAGEAILLMGGMGEFADKKEVKIIRNRGSGSTNEETFVVNMEDVLEKGDIDKDMDLQPGDFVIVPAKVINF